MFARSTVWYCWLNCLRTVLPTWQVTCSYVQLAERNSIGLVSIILFPDHLKMLLFFISPFYSQYLTSLLKYRICTEKCPDQAYSANEYTNVISIQIRSAMLFTRLPEAEASVTWLLALVSPSNIILHFSIA